MTRRINEITHLEVQVIALTSVKHIVYVFYKEDQPLYVGYSSVGLRRIFRHNKTQMVAESTRVCFVEAKTRAIGLALERQLIATLRTPYNFQRQQRIPLETVDLSSTDAPSDTTDLDLEFTEQQWSTIKTQYPNKATKYEPRTKYGPRTSQILDELAKF